MNAVPKSVGGEANGSIAGMRETLAEFAAQAMGLTGLEPHHGTVPSMTEWSRVELSDATTTAGPLPFSQLLTHVLDEHGGDRLTLSELSARLRDRAWGGLLLIFAAINLLPLPPGVTTVTGLPLIVLTAQMVAGRSRPWFPRKFDRRGVGKDHLRRIAEKMRPWEERIERVLKPRMCMLTNHRAARVIGLLSLLLSVILWLPIPLGNHVPALAMTLFALALIYRDGVVAILGVVATIASFILISFTFAAAWWAMVEVGQRLF